MPRSPQPLQRIFAADPALAAWTARHRRQSVLTAHVRRHLPRALAEHVGVADDRTPELTLAADSGAVAGIARQRAPDLLASLRREGYEFTSIRVRVQVGAGRGAIKKPISKQIDREALSPLSALADSLADGPLKASLARFLRRVG
jgi:hypothetical protein